MSGSFYNIMNMKSNIVNNDEHHSTPNLLEKQGIVSIKRTFSADMSSEKWLENNEFSLKRVKSSEHLQSLGEENDQSNEEIMNDHKDGSAGAAFEDIWSSILAQKNPVGAGAVSGDTALAPYVHPLMRRASSLSEKSLEICTESLGSETGSDGFSSPLSDRGEEQEKEVCEEVEETKNDDVVHVEEMKGFVEVVKYNFPVNNKKVCVGVPRSFPPPLPSLAHRDDGSNLHMRTRRHDGRLVLEAVSVPSKNCLQARRQGGRLLLTLTDEVDEEEKEQDVVEDEDENDKAKEKEAAFEVDETLALPQATRVTRKSSSTVTMTKLMELVSTRNKFTWPRMSNMTIVRSLDEEVEEDEKKRLVEVEPARLKAVSVGKSLLPPRPRVNTTTTDNVLNAYEYYWRRSNSSTAEPVAVLKSIAGKQNNFSDSVSPQVVNDGTKGMKMFLIGNNGKRVPQEEMVLFGSGEAGEKAENQVPLFRGCKDRRKSLFFFKPYCVATS